VGAGSRHVIRLVLVLALGALAAPTDAEPLPTADVRSALIETADAIDRTVLDEHGRARGDYNWLEGRWSPYEVAWHTGQAIEGLLAAHAVTADPRYLARARQAGDFWSSLELKHGPFAGMINAAHGDRLGPLINFTTVGNGTPGLFRLGRVTGERRYADVAAKAIAWLARNTQVPGHAGLYYNILDPVTGRIWTDRSPHHATPTPKVTQVARPNIEGSPFLDACEHLRAEWLCARHDDLARHTLARQDASGLWMEFEPNDPESGVVHPRFNLWNAEAMLRQYRRTRDRRFLDAALRTARTHAKMMRLDGSIDYDQRIDGTSGSAAPTGSATAFAGLLWLGLRAEGVAEFDLNIHRAARWLIANRFATGHPDPNLRGLVLELRSKSRNQSRAILQRDLGTIFAARFFEAYLNAFGQ
jgi:hypothetical protein